LGPEGGLTDAEINAAIKSGFSGIRLGPRVLRTETAAVATLSAIQTLWGDLHGIADSARFTLVCPNQITPALDYDCRRRSPSRYQPDRPLLALEAALLDRQPLIEACCVSDG